MAALLSDYILWHALNPFSNRDDGDESEIRTIRAISRSCQRFLIVLFWNSESKRMTLNYGVWWVNMTPLATTSNYRRTRRIYDYIYFMWRLTNSFSLHFVYGASWFISQSICFVWWVNIQRLGIGKIAASIISSIRIYKTLMVYLFIFIATQTASEIEE